MTEMFISPTSRHPRHEIRVPLRGRRRLGFVRGHRVLSAGGDSRQGHRSAELHPTRKIAVKDLDLESTMRPRPLIPKYAPPPAPPPASRSPPPLPPPAPP